MLNILFDIVIQPIIYVIEFAFSLLYRLTQSQGLSIIGVSVVVNLLCLPLYRMADEVQSAERATQAAMERWVTHIKRAFSGDEQYMMLSTYYDEQGYRPARALLGSLPLLLQIPFFVAAYTYLSGLGLLAGASFGPLANLGAPDGLVHVGGVTLNLLPLLMTALNCASTAVYTRGLPARDKLQAYGLAAVFLVLLYDSPSGLVFYWTCNQLFSLLKNVAMGALARRRQAAPGGEPDPEPAGPAPAPRPAGPGPAPAFFLAAALLAAVAGLLAPSAVIASSPTEFVNVYNYIDPFTNIVHATCVWTGLFVFWAGIYFLLAKPATRRVMACVAWCLAGAALLDYFVFGPSFGLLSAELVYDDPFAWSLADKLINAGAVAALCALLCVVWKRANNIVAPVLGVVLVAIVGLSVPNMLDIRGEVDELMASEEAQVEYFDEQGNVLPKFTLSRTGKNVVILFLDRALSGQLPYIMDEHPELEQQFDGFTYYPNTLSYAVHTNFGAPVLYGGYEYTPAAMNERADEKLKDKNNEALLVLPTIFGEAGYNNVVVDAPYANYKYRPDVSIYKGLKNTSAYRMSGAYSRYVYDEYGIPYRELKRTFAFYGMMRSLPRLLQGVMYQDGNYCSTELYDPPRESFMAEWAVLHLLPQLTQISDQGQDFLQIGNCTTHTIDFMEPPTYEPAVVVSREITEKERVHDGKVMLIDDKPRAMHYSANNAALLQVGRWFDWLREQGVYDNTRIIIVSDHGNSLAQFEGQQFDDELDIEMVNPLFMVKDFDAHGFTTSGEFMTNADTPTLALEGIVDNPVNPFTGNAITSNAKQGEQLVTISRKWSVKKNNGTVFDTSDKPWYSVHDNIFDLSNWKRVKEPAETE